MGNSRMHIKTQLDKRRNALIFSANREKRLPEEIFAGLYTLEKSVPQPKELSNSSEVNGLLWFIENSKNEYRTINGYTYAVLERINTENIVVAMSIYHDYEIDKDLFWCCITGGSTIDMSYFQNFSQYIRIVNNEARKLYDALDSFMKENS